MSAAFQLPDPQAAFNVRAYGIWINSLGEVLLSEETHGTHRIVKFPGGGLQFGEGLIDCLKREWLEETGLDLYVIRHYYTTDFFQRSAFDAQQQVLSVYYLITCPETFLTIDSLEGLHRFVWMPISKLSREVMTLPIDQAVAEQLRTDFAETLAVVA
jgi:8-oxo-dGTP diphosphatase